jgi:hypothetical protein
LSAALLVVSLVAYAQKTPLQVSLAHLVTQGQSKQSMEERANRSRAIPGKKSPNWVGVQLIYASWKKLQS